MKKRLLIASGGYADIPIIKAAKKLGFFVITSGHDENGLGNLHSDFYCKADNSDGEAILAVAKKNKVDAICPGAAGYSAVTCSYAAERMGIEHLDSCNASEILHYKNRFNKFAKEHNIPLPKTENFNDTYEVINKTENFKFPLIIKPADLSGGKGISIVKNNQEAKVAILNAFDKARIKIIVAEEFIDGSNHGFSTIIRNGRVSFYFFDNEYYFINRYNVAGTFTPGDVPEKVIAILNSIIEKIVSILKLKNGIFHLQFVLKNNKPFIIDICRRVPGDLYISFVKYATGVDYPLFMVKAYTGMNIDDLEQKFPDGYYGRHVIMGDRNGNFKGIDYDDSIKKNIIDEFMIFKEGDKINNFMSQRLGIVFLKYSSKEEMIGKNANIQELIRAEVKE